MLIQTRLPSHHAVRCAVAHDYHGFVAQELAGRADPPYPPTVRLTNVVFSGVTEQATADLAERGTAWLRALLKRHDGGDRLTLLGPAPCPIERIKNRWRWHLVLKSSSASEMTRVARYFLEKFEVPKTAQLRVTVDRDPVALL